MNYVGRLLSSFKTFYSEINTATLTGAIDVIVVEQEDGSLLCSPFHVRFGKMGVLRSREKCVYIEINGEQVDLHMKLGENGEAFFLEEAAVEDKVPAHLCSSPLLSTIALMEDGIKRLHAEASSIRSETESSKESDASLGKDLTLDNKLTSSGEMSDLKEKDAVLDDGKQPELDHSIVDMTEPANGEQIEIKVETEAAEGKSKKLLHFEGVNRAADVDVENVSEEELTQLKSNSSSAKDTLIRIESETKSSRRGKLTKKRRRKGMTAKPARSDKQEAETLAAAKSSLSRRLMNLSESSTSSSQHSDDEIFQIEDVSEEEEVERGIALRSFKPMVKSDVWGEVCSEMLKVNIPQHPLSDGDVTPSPLSPVCTRPPTPKSDTELETSRQTRGRAASGHIRSSSSTEKIEWNWGELPERRLSRTPLISADDEVFESLANLKNKDDDKPSKEEGGEADLESQKTGETKTSVWSKLNVFRNIQHSQGIEKGMYLQDLASEEIDPEVYALYFPERAENSSRIEALRDEDKSSDLGASLPQSPNTVEEVSIDIEYEEETSESSMDLQMSLCGGLKDEDDTVPHDLFIKDLVSYEEFCKTPGLLSNPNLVVRLDGKCYNWQAAGPIVISYLAFRRPLPEMVVSNLMKDQVPKGKRSLTSWLWGTSKPPTTPKKETDAIELETAQQEGDEQRHPEETVYWSDETESSERASVQDQVPSVRSQSGIYKKSIRLSSEQLAKLNLKPGPNVIRYSVTTRYQGTTMCESTVYLWKHDIKLVISDIDGTITRSDVFGQILPVLGKDWTHGGVAQLFSQIQNNGYHFLYLSSRAIGQARHTKGYLKSVCQDKFDLPDGPLLLNPSSLIRAFHREVIIKKPEEFKIRCLKDILSLYPSSSNKSSNPFYAGFGNRINDTWAYRAVGVPVSRIFTINSQGKVTHDLTYTFQSSYPKMRDLADHVFPPLHRKRTMAFVSPHEFSSFTFWREPMLELPADDDLLRDLASKDKK